MTTTLPTPSPLPPKDSFDRFGDDLSGLLLAQLPTLADRFRYGCVCRQWQRLVYNGQQELVIDRELMDKLEANTTGESTPAMDRLSKLLAKCPLISAIKLRRDYIDYDMIHQIMDVLVDNNNTAAADGGQQIYSYEVRSRQSESHTDLYRLVDQIKQFRRLRHLAIDCPLVYGSSNPCANVLPAVANMCPDIQSLKIRVNCFVAANLRNILRDVQLFPRLERLKLGLYTVQDGQRVFSVKLLANCPKLKYLWLQCSPDMSFTDVDKINGHRRLLKPAIVSTGDPYNYNGYSSSLTGSGSDND